MLSVAILAIGLPNESNKPLICLVLTGAVSAAPFAAPKSLPPVAFLTPNFAAFPAILPPHRIPPPNSAFIAITVNSPIIATSHPDIPFKKPGSIFFIPLFNPIIKSRIFSPSFLNIGIILAIFRIKGTIKGIIGANVTSIKAPRIWKIAPNVPVKIWDCLSIPLRLTSNPSFLNMRSIGGTFL